MKTLEQVRSEITKLERELGELIAEDRQKKFEILNQELTIGTWHCTLSPVETCVYAYNPDCCIFCDQPEERK